MIDIHECNIFIFSLRDYQNVSLDDGNSGFIGPNSTINGATITRNETLPYSGSPYTIYGTFSIAVGGSLTIEPGVILKFDIGAGIVVAGTLVVNGTADYPVIFTSLQVNPARGDWSRIYFTSQAQSSILDSGGNWIGGSLMRHCVVSFAGRGPLSAILIAGSSPLLEHVTVTQSVSNGVEISNIPTIFTMRDSIIEFNTGYGFYVSASVGATASVVLENISIRNNNYGIYARVSCRKKIIVLKLFRSREFSILQMSTAASTATMEPTLAMEVFKYEMEHLSTIIMQEFICIPRVATNISK
jgi:hypothetical protein